ncbi:MAG: YaiO family outer membrane beta-barrel protein [bacterium]|jgi:YaiO family outer membrane protein|nr:YaiO family outer membrane beta-barrel protein [bacterium]
MNILLLFLLAAVQLFPTSMGWGQPTQPVLPAPDSDPLSYEAQFETAKQNALGGRYEEAIRLYSQMLATYPENTDLLMGRGLAYSWSGNYTDALVDLETVTQRTPNNAEAWLAYGNACFWSGKNEAALTAYGKCIAINPANPEPHIARAKIYSQAGQGDLARQELESAVQKGAPPTLLDILSPFPTEEETVIEKRRKAPQSITPHPFWEAAFSYDFTDLHPSGSDWQIHTTAIRRETESGVIGIEGILAERFNYWDEGVAVEAYHELWDNAYGNLRLQGMEDAEVMPHFDGWVEIYQGILDSWEVSGSIRYMNFTDGDIKIYGVGAAKYIGNWYLRGKTTFSTGLGTTDVSQTFLIRHYFGVTDNYAHFQVTFGDESTLIGEGPHIESRANETFVLGFQKFLTPSFGIFADLHYQDVEDAAERRGILAGIRYRW